MRLFHIVTYGYFLNTVDFCEQTDSLHSQKWLLHSVFASLKI